MMNLSYLFGCLLYLLPGIITDPALSRHENPDVSPKAPPTFELQEGDRVVFLGNSLMEDEQQYGYLEFALTSRWPERSVTFRNLGWTGDTVFGDARSYFTSPPNAYELLLQQIAEAKPSVVFLAYGANESYEGEAGLDRFAEGLNRLLDKIDSLGANTVLLSPIPQMVTEYPVTNRSAHNKDLELYSSAIARAASERELRFIDLLTPFRQLSEEATVTTDGIHLNELGYYHLASIIEDELGLPARRKSIRVDLSRPTPEASEPSLTFESDPGDDLVKFTADDPLLPLPLPKQGGTEDAIRTLSVRGLKGDCYTLRINNSQVMAATGPQWAEEVGITQGPMFSQADQLQDYILKKNELFFRQYRPLNRTYIVGFRSYEQGTHNEELKQLDILIGWLEEQIASIRAPKSEVYQLTPIK